MPGIAEVALNNSRITILFMVLVFLSGVFVFLEYPRREDPSIVIREAVVTARFPGMSPRRVENLITRRLEEKIREIGEVDEIRSDSKTGVAIVHVIIQDQYFDLDPIWQDLRNKMADVAPELPEGTIGPFVDDDFGLTVVATIALWADGFSLAEMREVARETRDLLYTLDGILRVEIFGIQDERIFLEISNTRMSQLGMAPGIIFQTLREQNIILPGGRIRVQGQNIVIEPSGNFDDVAAIESVVIPIPDTDRTIPLIDLAEVRRGYVDPAVQPVYFNGRPAIVLGVSIQDGVNSVEFGTRLTRFVDAVEQTLPFGYFLDFATFQPDLVEAAVGGAVGNVYQSLAIVLVVVMLFMGFRTGLIVGAFVPMAMLLGLIIMRLLDIEMQRMSIASLIIALGMLVDNGIVVAEDIRARMDGGQARREAAIRSGRTLAIPLLVASLTTILAFGPIVLAEGGTGEYTLSLGQVIAIVLLASWFLAMFMTPTLCVWFMKESPPAPAGVASDPFAGRFYQVYRGLLATLLRRRYLALLGVFGALALALWGFRLIEPEFFPNSDRNQFLVYLDLPAGSNADMTTGVVERLTAWLGDPQANPEIASTVAYVGSGGPRFFLSLAPIDADPHVAFILVNTVDADVVPALVQRTRSWGLDHIPEARTRAIAMWFGAAETGLLQIRIQGIDPDIMLGGAERLLAALRDIPGTLDARQDWENRVLALNVEVDQARARRAGVTSTEVAETLNAFLDGVTVTDYREGDTIIPVVVRGGEDERENLGAFGTISVFSRERGTSVPLSQIADITGGWQLSRISRLDQVRTVTVTAKHQFLGAAELMAALMPAYDALDLPPGYELEIAGEIVDQEEANANLFANLPFCFALIVLLLVWQFNSIRRPLIILFTIPLTLIGVVPGLLIMGATFGFMVILGLLSLAGIIINNGIVLIDRIEIERAAGREVGDAIVMAALARFRPILMTTMTTVLGLLPLILSRDPLFYGMACAIAFGLAIGTVLTLGVVPVLYSILFRAPAPALAETAAAAAD